MLNYFTSGKIETEIILASFHFIYKHHVSTFDTHEDIVHVYSVVVVFLSQISIGYLAIEKNIQTFLKYLI